MNTPFLSVCVITYNHEKYISQCLDGILMQKTNFVFEVIVGEDCSTDGTREIIRQYQIRYPGIVKPIYHEKNVGGARNGYEYCYPRLTGKYIAICEGDDYWSDPGKLQKQVDFLEANPGHSFCFHHVGNVDENNKTSKGQQPSEKIVSYDSSNIFHISIPTLSVVFKKCFDAIPTEMYNAKSGDTFLFGLLSGYGKAADLGFLGAYYRKHSGGVYNSLKPLDQFKQAIATRRLMKHSAAFAKEQKKEIQREIVKRKWYYLRYFFKKMAPADMIGILLA